MSLKYEPASVPQHISVNTYTRVLVQAAAARGAETQAELEAVVGMLWGR